MAVLHGVFKINARPKLPINTPTPQPGICSPPSAEFRTRYFMILCG